MNKNHLHHRYTLLLEQYFQGETTLAQEEQLRQYFQTGRILPEHLPYAPLFTYLQIEKEQLAPLTSPIAVFTKRIIYSGVAAVFAILLITGGILLTHKTSPGIYRLTIAGEQVNDKQLAVNIAKEKLDRLNSILDKMNERTERAVTAVTLPQQLNLLNRFSQKEHPNSHYANKLVNQ